MVVRRLFWAILFPFGLSVQAGVDFAREVRPFLAEHCLECHGPDDAKGGLELTSLEAAVKELESGARGIVPGEVDQSEIIRRMFSSDSKEQMPPPKHRTKHPVSTEQMEMMKRWVAEGARFEAHWAYQPVRRVEPPPVAPHAVDAFVRERLREEGIQPAAAADRVTLIRRVHYDLLGLPPAVEEVDAFVADDSDTAYETMVDRALASGHFGERWGRHWLDMARYADSDGYEKDRPRPDAWRFRDWVIRAINDDMPFDQFTIEQLAGDLLPDATSEQVVATAFNRQTLTNTEGGTDQEQFRVEACFDRAETLGTVWLGLTVGCARCHTHKYDQITQAEYFQLFAFFNNADEVTRQAPISPDVWADYEQQHGAEARALVPLKRKLDKAKNDLPVKLPAWEKEVQIRLADARAQPERKQIFRSFSEAAARSEEKVNLKRLDDGSFLALGTQAKQDVYEIELGGAGQRVTALKLEVLTDSSLPKEGPGRSSGGNFVLSEVEAGRVDGQGRVVDLLLHSPEASFQQKGYAAAGVVDGQIETGWAISGGTGKAQWLNLQLAEPVALAKGEKLILRLRQHYPKGGEHCIGRFRVLAAEEETEASIAPAAVLRILDEEPKRRNPVVVQALYDWLEKLDPDVQSAAKALAAAESKLPKPPLMDVRVMGQRAQDMRTTRVLMRGDFLSPGDVVAPDTLEVLPPMTKPGAEPTRLDLARWLVSGDNPLTARVAVNHAWTQLFGEGLVRSVADFGVRGETPSHPELLDWLASEFMKRGWSRKQLLRLILTSETYKQSSDANLVADGVRAEAEQHRLQEQDPLNTLLWRQNRLRVQGEIVRDLHLAAAGLLSPKIGGPSVFPPMPKDVADLSYASNFKWETSTGEDRYRRGFYTFFKRTAPHPELMTFDCPDANLTNVRRSVSNTPLQALATLNAEAFAEAARGLALRVLKPRDLTDAERLQSAFRICLSRSPESHELRSLQMLLEETRYHYKQAENSEVEEASGGVNQGEAAVELAAYSAVTRIILNLDEFITRG